MNNPTITIYNTFSIAYNLHYQQHHNTHELRQGNTTRYSYHNILGRLKPKCHLCHVTTRYQAHAF